MNSNKSKKIGLRVIILMLILSLALPMSSFATVKELRDDATAPGKSLAGTKYGPKDVVFQYSISEEATHKVTFETNLDNAALEAAKSGGTIKFSLDRDTSRAYLDPALSPNQFAGGPIEKWVTNKTVTKPDGQRTTEEVKEIEVQDITVNGKTLEVTFKTSGTEYYYTQDTSADSKISKVYSIDHNNYGIWLDKCGYYNLNVTVDGKAAGKVAAKVVPYDSYRTPYELFDELEALKSYKGSRYVEVGSIGNTSSLDYDLPYVVVASDKKSVDRWLEYTELSEKNPEQALANIKAGKYNDMKVPIYISNCHTNENSAVNGILNFIQVLVNEEIKVNGQTLVAKNDLVKDGKISLRTLEDYTELGKSTLKNEKDNIFKTGLSKIYGAWTNKELGRLRGENGDTKARGVTYGYSSTISNWEKYYTTGKDEFSIDELLDDVFFVVVPTMNMEGYMRQVRAAGLGFDPNRDYANQTQDEDRAAMAFMAKWNPMVYDELHGRVEGMLVEPCGAPHNPNIEYDLIGKKFVELGEALGNSAVANNEKFNSYEMPCRDYIELDPDSPTGVQWGTPWDDLSTNFGSQFPVFYGTCGITWEQPAYDDIDAEQVVPNGLLGQGRYVQENKIVLLTAQAELYKRGVNNENSNSKVAKYYVNQYDQEGAEADIMRPVFDGEGQNKNFYPECLIIPLDKENQKNLQDAAEAVLWIARNDLEYMIADKPFTYDGVTYPEGTVVASMYQACRSLLNANFGPGAFVSVWKGLYSEAFSQIPYARGFDIITVAEPAQYKKIVAACKDGYDYEGTMSYLANFASQFSGVKNADVIISNASEDSAGAVNALLKAGKTVGMITEGDHMGDFICAYDDFVSVVAKEYIVSAEGVYGAEEGIKAKVIAKSPAVYVIGGDAPRTTGNIELKGGNQYYFDMYAVGQMGFDMTDKSTKADAIVGNSFNSSKTNDAAAKQAVLDGTPLMIYGSGAGLLVDPSDANRNRGYGILNGVETSAPENGTDMLANVKYPTLNLINANYALDEDYLNYQYGTSYFTSIPEGATVLVQNDTSLKEDGKEPLVGCVGLFGDADLEAEFEEYGHSPVAFEYKKDGLDIVAFANSLVHKGHPQDEFKYIANFLFTRVLADDAYAVTAAPVVPETPEQQPATQDKPAADNNATTITDVPKTGDETNLLGWFALMLVAGASGTAVIVVRKKRRVQ